MSMALGAGVTPRQPLGLPAGSVRAILTFMVLGLVWTLMLLPSDKTPEVPLYIYYLMFLSLGSFFSAHGRSIAGPTSGTHSPLYLPKGSLRTLIFLGFGAVLGWQCYSKGNLDAVKDVMKQPQLSEPILPFVLLGGFLLGILISRITNKILAGPSGLPAWVQDIQAWIALLATLGLLAEVIIQAVINPGLPDEKRLHLPQFQMFLAAITGFYYGVRS